MEKFGEGPTNKVSSPHPWIPIIPEKAKLGAATFASWLPAKEVTRAAEPGLASKVIGSPNVLNLFRIEPQLQQNSIRYSQETIKTLSQCLEAAMLSCMVVLLSQVQEATTSTLRAVIRR